MLSRFCAALDLRSVDTSDFTTSRVPIDLTRVSSIVSSFRSFTKPLAWWYLRAVRHCSSARHSLCNRNQRLQFSEFRSPIASRFVVGRLHVQRATVAELQTEEQTVFADCHVNCEMCDASKRTHFRVVDAHAARDSFL